MTASPKDAQRAEDERSRTNPSHAEFEARLRRIGDERYHHRPPFNLRMHDGTLTPEETTGVIDRFCDAHPGFQVEDPRQRLPAAARKLVDKTGALRTLPQRHGCDGFYAVRLVRT